MFHHLRATERERGAALVEYVFLIGLIAVTLIMSISFFTARLAMSFSEAGESLQGTVSEQSDPGTDDSDSDSDD